MELIALWKVVKRRWWLIGLPPVVVLVLTLPALADAVNGVGAPKLLALHRGSGVSARRSS